MKNKFILGLVTMMLVAGCMNNSQTAQTTQTTTNPAPTVDVAGTPSFTHRANGKTYRIHYRHDRMFNMTGVVLFVEAGKPFQGVSTEDAEVQNTLRNGFREAGYCDAGLHPGVLQFGYGPIQMTDGTWGWGAKIRCSKVNQQNI